MALNKFSVFCVVFLPEGFLAKKKPENFRLFKLYENMGLVGKCTKSNRNDYRR